MKVIIQEEYEKSQNLYTINLISNKFKNFLILATNIFTNTILHKVFKTKNLLIKFSLAKLCFTKLSFQIN